MATRQSDASRTVSSQNVGTRPDGETKGGDVAKILTLAGDLVPLDEYLAGKYGD